jgi:predicted  nucleic acid-binding Zn-ribbon protein
MNIYEQAKKKAEDELRNVKSGITRMDQELGKYAQEMDNLRNRKSWLEQERDRLTYLVHSLDVAARDTAEEKVKV